MKYILSPLFFVIWFIGYVLLHFKIPAKWECKNEWQLLQF